MRNATRRREIIDDEPAGLASAALSVARRRPVDTLAGVLAAACAVMILVNALALQEGRRGAARPGPAAEEASRPAASVAPKRSDLVAQIQGALADRGFYDGPVDGLMGAQTASAIRAFEHAERLDPTGEASAKVLAAALTSSGRKAQELAAPAAPARTAQQQPAQKQTTAPQTTGSTDVAGPKLMAVQRALAKIGYGPVTIDGKMGAETRNAIVSFEKDRGMPSTGEPSPAVLRALQAMTGAPLQ